MYTVLVTPILYGWSSLSQGIRNIYKWLHTRSWFLSWDLQ